MAAGMSWAHGQFTSLDWRDGGQPRAFDQKIGQDFFVILVGDDLPIIRAEFVAAGAQVFQEQIYLLQVFVANGGRFGDETERTFQIDKTHRAVELEIQLGAIEQMEKREV